MKHISFFIFAFVLLAACKEHRPEEKFFIDTDDNDTTTVADKKYKGLRVYEGTIPCADCAGIVQQLVLKGDSVGIYRLKELYKNATEDGDSELISSGEWKRMKTGSSYMYYLSEKNIRDSIRTMKYQINGDIIEMMDTFHDSIKSTAHYRLKLIRSN